MVKLEGDIRIESEKMKIVGEFRELVSSSHNIPLQYLLSLLLLLQVLADEPDEGEISSTVYVMF